MAEIDLNDLADRVETLEGPCRKTDLAIVEAVKTGMRHPWFMAPPAFTASLDAAMSLVPDQAWWWVEAQPLVHGQFFAGCADERVAKGKTPALALTAAALRARLREGEGEK